MSLDIALQWTLIIFVGQLNSCIDKICYLTNDHETTVSYQCKSTILYWITKYFALKHKLEPKLLRYPVQWNEIIICVVYKQFFVSKMYLPPSLFNYLKICIELRLKKNLNSDKNSFCMYVKILKYPWLNILLCHWKMA